MTFNECKSGASLTKPLYFCDYLTQHKDTKNYSPKTRTRSSAVAERSRNASWQWIFRKTIRDHSRSLEMAPFGRSRTSSYWRSIVTMAILYNKSFLRSKIAILHTTPAFDAPVRGSPPECWHNVWYGKSITWFSRLDTIPACDRSTDGVSV